MVNDTNNRSALIADLEERLAACGPEGWCTVAADVLRRVIGELRAQMPRVMTLDEAKAHVGNPVWVEEKVVVNGYWEILFDVDGEAFHMTTGQIEFGGMLTGHMMFAVSDYGDGFRLWTSRPSDEQRQNTPWEGEKNA